MDHDFRALSATKGTIRRINLVVIVQCGLDLILGDSCKAMIAFSDATRNIAALDWECRFGAAEAHLASAKAQVLLPPQPVLSGATPRPGGAWPLFVFGGGDFYRTGSLLVLQAL